MPEELEIGADGRYVWLEGVWRHLSEDRLWWWDGTSWQPLSPVAEELTVPAVRQTSLGIAVSQGVEWFWTGRKWQKLVEDPKESVPAAGRQGEAPKDAEAIGKRLGRDLLLYGSLEAVESAYASEGLVQHRHGTLAVEGNEVVARLASLAGGLFGPKKAWHKEVRIPIAEAGARLDPSGITLYRNGEPLEHLM